MDSRSRDAGQRLADLLGHALASQAGVDEPLVAVGLIDRGELLANEVLDHGQLQAARVGIDRTDGGGDVRAAGLDRGQKALLTGDQVVVAVLVGGHDDGLEHAVDADGGHELSELLGIAVATRIEPVDDANARDGESPQLAFHRHGLLGGGAHQGLLMVEVVPPQCHR